MQVYVLTGELNGPSFDPTDPRFDFSGVHTVHASLDGALARLDAWLAGNSIDLDTAHHGEYRTDTFIGNDVDPDLLDGNVLSWRINTTEVQP